MPVFTRSIAIFAPLLSGHGRTAEILAQTGWKEWFATARDAFDELAQLDPADRASIKLLLQRGALTDSEALRELNARGFGDRGSAFEGIAHRTSLVRRTQQQRDDSERVYGYRGTWTINPDLRAVLDQLLDEGKL